MELKHDNNELNDGKFGRKPLFGRKNKIDGGDRRKMEITSEKIKKSERAMKSARNLRLKQNSEGKRV